MISVITIIPARGGSKGIPKKNIVPLGGKPLLVYTIESTLKAQIGGPVVVSTDDDEIARIARENGAEVVIRPSEISGDSASTESALLHALDVVEKQGFKADAVLTLQPTSPMRKAATIKQFIEKFDEIKGKYDAMLSLHENRMDFWVKKNEDGGFGRLFPNAPRRRQAREPLYEENSVLYITNTEALRRTNSVLGEKTAGFVIDADEAIDINEPCDILFAEFLMQQRKDGR